MKLLVVGPSPLPILNPLRRKYSPQDPVFIIIIIIIIIIIYVFMIVAKTFVWRRKEEDRLLSN